MLSQMFQKVATNANRDATPEENERLLPVIDFGPMLAGEPGARELVIEQLRSACEYSGFFQIVHHSISHEVFRNAFRASKRFFELPFEEKLELSKDMFSNRGYELVQDFVLEGEETAFDSQEVLDGCADDDWCCSGSTSNLAATPAASITTTGAVNGSVSSGSNAAVFEDEIVSNEFRESFYFGSENLSAERLMRPFQGPNKWPLHSGNDFRLMRLLAESLGLSEHAFDDFCSDPTTAIRLLRYPPAGGRVGVNDHRDAAALTLMAQDGVAGLQIFDPELNQFLAVSPRKDALVANLGDIMTILTNHRYKSSLHRVCNTSSQDRYTIPFFLQGNIDYVVAPLPELGPPQSEPVAVEDLLRDHFQNSYTSHTTSVC
ncbi:2-OG-Fe(II) oxygenase superfamily protein [Schizosaccharomyces japonicus yFS275]|uniref:2-OG-Fe(II) oxygenase superfamily protein n=1 Tax=Schizosaccharomyces japonicus (strain yFS275 / FY16936) TaxID=402676 RepID=B6K774_SCHJY|nr:2-OG-Fe(II) oxygenase superfamily protein [Schizosaccharomyces japonicus yFS275]EEB09378.1 2-OG-Fe(II) oxygenase superfamily protein [Schizosaccharomyces japonicus yFS275]